MRGAIEFFRLWTTYTICKELLLFLIIMSLTKHEQRTLEDHGQDRDNEINLESTAIVQEGKVESWPISVKVETGASRTLKSVWIWFCAGKKYGSSFMLTLWIFSLCRIFCEGSCPLSDVCFWHLCKEYVATVLCLFLPVLLCSLCLFWVSTVLFLSLRLSSILWD